MKLSKNLLLVLLALVLVLSLGVFAAAESAEEPSADTIVTVVETGNCGAEGSDVRYTLYSNNTLVISGTGEIKTHAFENNAISPTTDIIIEDGITAVGAYAFNNYAWFGSGLSDSCPSVVLADSVKTIGMDAFAGCWFRFFDFGSVERIERNAFYMTTIAEVVLPDTLKFIGMQNFQACMMQNTTVVFGENLESIDNFVFQHSTLEKAVFLNGNTELDATSGESFLPHDPNKIPVFYSYPGGSVEAYANQYGYPFVDLGTLEETDHDWDEGAVTRLPTCTEPGEKTYVCRNNPTHTYTKDIPVSGHVLLESQAVPPFSEEGAKTYTCIHCGGLKVGENPVLTILASGECGESGNNVVYTLYSDGTLVISGTGKMKYWTHVVYTPWADLRDNIVRVIIQPGVTNVGYHAFEYATVLENVVLPEGIEYIGDSAFCGCEKLTSINIPSTVRNIYDHAFHFCTGLPSIDMQNSKITSVAFCAFKQCYKLETVTLPPTVTTIRDSAFSDCQRLRQINIPAGVTSIGEFAFNSCRSMENVVLPDSITHIYNYAFDSCVKANFQTLPANLEVLGELAFQDCNFESVTLPEHLVSVARRAFARNKNLTTVTVPASVESIDSTAFAECTALTAYTVAPENRSYMSVDGVLFTKDGATLLDYPAAKPGSFYAVPDGVTELANEAFGGCSQLTDLFLPDGLTTVGDQAFSGCSGLAALQIPQGVTAIGGAAFRGCAALERIELPDTLERMGSFTFDNCTSLRSVTLPASLTSIGHYTFGMCSALETVILPAEITSIPEGFSAGCYALREVHYVGSVDQWFALSVNQYGNDAFKNAAVHIHDDYGSLASIDSAYWEALPTSAAGLPKGAGYLDFTDAVKDRYPAEQQAEALAMLGAGSWSLDEGYMTLKGALMLPAALYPAGADKQITWYPSRDVLAFALHETGQAWIKLPYSTDGLNDGDWYLDLDAFMDAIGRGNSEEEKAEVRDLLLQHVTFFYNPGGTRFVYRFDYNNLPVDGGETISGSTTLPVDLMLGDEDAFLYDYTVLQNCVVQYHKDQESWFQQNIVGPLRSFISTILSFFRRLFKII